MVSSPWGFSILGSIVKHPTKGIWGDALAIYYWTEMPFINWNVSSRGPNYYNEYYVICEWILVHMVLHYSTYLYSVICTPGEVVLYDIFRCMSAALCEQFIPTTLQFYVLHCIGWALYGVFSVVYTISIACAALQRAGHYIYVCISCTLNWQCVSIYSVTLKIYCVAQRQLILVYAIGTYQ